MNHRIVALLVACLALVASRANAAEGYDNCTGFVDSLPATIATQGTWCLRDDLSTAMTSGAAITIAANNVTLDCNHFKVGGLAAGPGTLTTGVFAEDHGNVVVRQCNVRGFYTGIAIYQGSGAVVEDNRIEASLHYGIELQGAGADAFAVARRNLVLDTGGTQYPIAIRAFAGVQVLDNLVDRIASTADGSLSGIQMFGAQGSIVGNRIRGLAPGPGADAYGIRLFAAQAVNIRDNDLFGPGAAGSVGVFCDDASSRVRDNLVNGFAQSLATCANAGGNDLFN